MTILAPTTITPTISLESANELAELQTRVDRKYVVNESMLAQLLGDLPSTYRQLCVEGSVEFNYSSVYFDTPELQTYRAAAHRRRRRFKVRTRTYQDSGSCMLEVKTKGPRGVTVKTRSAYDREDSGYLTGDACRFIDGVIGRNGGVEEMRPVLTVQYRRSTLVDVATRSRLTMDRSLRCVDSDGGIARLDAVIVETKSDGRRSLADRWLWRQGVRPLTLSKFAIGLALNRPDLPSNRWHRAMQRGWHVE
jgi:hypothetical protein